MLVCGLSFPFVFFRALLPLHLFFCVRPFLNIMRLLRLHVILAEPVVHAWQLKCESKRMRLLVAGRGLVCTVEVVVPALN